MSDEVIAWLRVGAENAQLGFDKDFGVSAEAAKSTDYEVWE